MERVTLCVQLIFVGMNEKEMQKKMQKNQMDR